MSGHREHVTPSEAASLAAHQYVWETSYRAGVEAGWEAAWQEIHSKLISSSSTTPASAQNDPPSTRLEMDPRWAALFLAGEKRRELEKKKMEKEEMRNKGNVEDVVLGGIRDEQNRERKVEIYGVNGAALVRGREARIEERFQNALTKFNPPLWPVLPLNQHK